MPAPGTVCSDYINRWRVSYLCLIGVGRGEVRAYGMGGKWVGMR